MLEGLERIRNVRELLTDQETSLAQRLLDAGQEFQAAIFFQEEWPRELRERADGLQVRLLSAGSMAPSIAAMDDETLDATAEELFVFTKAAEELDTTGMRHG